MHRRGHFYFTHPHYMTECALQGGQLSTGPFTPSKMAKNALRSVDAAFLTPFDRDLRHSGEKQTLVYCVICLIPS